VRRAQCFVNLVQHQVAHALQLELLRLKVELAHASRRPDQELRTLLANALNLPAWVRSTGERHDAQRRVFQQHLSHAVRLVCELARGRKDECLRLLA